jgi:DNA-binding MarR family transcriptional regulator
VPALATSAQNYLNQTLGVSTSRDRPWAGQESLPYFLRDAFDFRQLDILGHKVLLALERNPDKPSIGDIRNRLDKLRSVAKQPVVYVTEALASYERKRLIAQKVPFIVPGNQLYLPDLGLDLREYFRQRRSPADVPLSPSAQAMLITALLRPSWEAEWHPAETAAILGYTPMTLSRAVRELVAAGLAQIHKAGRSQYLSMAYSPQETWEQALPLLRNPVQRTVWTPTQTRTEELPVRVAGLSALARLSMLAEPGSPVFAVSRTAWQAMKADMVELPEAMPGTCEWELWNYAPTLQPDSDTVDPLSLMLSLRDSTDERVQSALDALKEQLPW